MARPHPLSPHPDEAARRRERLEDADDDETFLRERLERAAEHASLPYHHPALHRLARAERARRTGMTDGREAA